MGEFRVMITTRGAAFGDGRNLEIARIVRQIADKLDLDISGGRLTDSNGNPVGDFGFMPAKLQTDDHHATVPDSTRCGTCGHPVYVDHDNDLLHVDYPEVFESEHGSHLPIRAN